MSGVLDGRRRERRKFDESSENLNGNYNKNKTMKILPISWFLKVKCVFNKFVYSLQDLLTWFIIFEYEDKRASLV